MEYSELIAKEMLMNLKIGDTVLFKTFNEMRLENLILIDDALFIKNKYGTDINYGEDVEEVENAFSDPVSGTVKNIHSREGKFDCYNATGVPDWRFSLSMIKAINGVDLYRSETLEFEEASINEFFDVLGI